MDTSDGYHEGGCACGLIRYRIAADPLEAGWCHCWTCQRLSGSPGLVWASVARSSFSYSKGAAKVRTFSLSRHATRSFASCCGSPLTAVYEFQPDSIDVTAGSLDNPNIARPQYHVFDRGAPEWLELRDSLPRHDRFRPSTPGLRGTALTD